MRANAETRIVLVGGGHAHVHVVKALAGAAGIRLTLVARDLLAPYSGMLPGVVAGLYRPEDAQIDLAALAAACGAHLVHAAATSLDRANKHVTLADGLTLPYDLVSIDVGIAPAVSTIAGAAMQAIAVKPVSTFLERFAALRAACRADTRPRRIVTIGGGAGGVELVLAMQARLLADARADGRPAPQFALITAENILPNHAERVRTIFRRIFAERGIALHERRCAVAVDHDRVEIEGSQAITSDTVLLATGATAPAWFAATGLALDRNGFLAVAPTLQSLADPDVFAAGDCANLVESPREKAGVFAVRAGPRLADALMRRARGEHPRSWWPQRQHLAIISTGERYAVASRGRFAAEGRWVWWWKDRLDRRFMARYRTTTNEG